MRNKKKKDPSSYQRTVQDSFINLSFDTTRGMVDVQFNTLIQISLPITNQGDSIATHFSIGLFLSPDTNISTTDYLIDTVFIDTLPPGDTFLYSFKTQLGETLYQAPGGYYHLGIFIDYKEEVDEWTEADNRFLYTSNLIGVPFCDSTGSVLCGDSLTDGSGGNAPIVPFSHCNWLITADSGKYIVLDFPNYELSEEQLFVYDGNNIAAPLLERYNSQTYPEKIISSGNALFLEMVSNSPFTEAGWTSSTACIDMEVVDLSSPIWPQQLEVTGTKVELAIEVHNRGNIPSPPDSVHFFASSTLTLDPWKGIYTFSQDYVLGAIAIPALNPKESTLVTFSTDAGQNTPPLPPGDYFVSYFIDADSTVDEWIETNNGSYAGYTPPSWIDPVFSTTLTIPDTVTSINQYSTSFHLYPNPVRNTLWVENRTGIPCSGYQLHSIDGTLLEGKSYTHSFSKNFEITFSEYPAGFYILQLHSKEGTNKYKIIKW